MGCFDMYCSICDGPFVNYNSWDLPGMEGIDTEWLTKAMIHYYDTNTKVNVIDYDDDGRFEEADGTVHDVVELVDTEKAVVYHTLCVNRKPTEHMNVISDYCEQHFDIERMIEDGNQRLLAPPVQNY